MLYIELELDNGDKITTNDVINKLELCCYEHGLDEGLKGLNEISTPQFNNILQDVGRTLFFPLDVFITKSPHIKFNITKLKVLLDLYIYLCNEYDKSITTKAFLLFCGISGNNIDTFECDNGLTSFRQFLTKKTDDADNIRMLGKAQDSKQAVLNIAYNNYRHNWGGTIRSQEVATVAKSLEDVRRERIATYAEGGQITRFDFGNSDESP